GARRRHEHDLADARDARRHRGHQHRGRVCRAPPWRVDPHPVERPDLLAEDGAVLVGEAPRLRRRHRMIALDPLRRVGQSRANLATAPSGPHRRGAAGWRARSRAVAPPPRAPRARPRRAAGPLPGLSGLLQALLCAVSRPPTSPEYLPPAVVEAKGYRAP